MCSVLSEGALVSEESLRLERPNMAATTTVEVGVQRKTRTPETGVGGGPRTNIYDMQSTARDLKLTNKKRWGVNSVWTERYNDEMQEKSPTGQKRYFSG